MAATLSCGPSSAAAAAAWPTVEMPAETWPCTVTIALISARGPAAKPMRQPVIA